MKFMSFVRMGRMTSLRQLFPKYQFLRIMKLTFVLVLLMSVHVSAIVMGQKVSLHINKQHLSHVLQELRKQTGYAFVYKDNDIAHLAPLTLRIADGDLMSVLPILSRELHVEFRIKDKVISVIPKENITNAPIETEEVRIQDYTISGQIVNTSGQPIANASIALIDNKGIKTALQTKTNETGNFSLKVNSSLQIARVEVSHLGYKTKTVASEYNLGKITLESNESELDEVFIPISTGYQIIKPEQSTGAIAQLSTKEYESRISTNFLDGLVNRIPGLMINDQVMFTSQAPDGSTSSRPLFNIRGISTMSANQQPLIVIDGYPTELTLEMIDPNEIKSVTVLKDAAAATVYGVRASNGVIVIERKQAVQGAAKFAFRATAGVAPQENYSRYRWDDNASRIVTDYQRDLLSKSVNANSWGQLATAAAGTVRRSPIYYILAQRAANIITADQEQRAFEEMYNYDNLQDYQRLFNRPAVTQSYNFNVSGGSNTALYYITANYTNRKGTNKGSDNGRFLLSARTTMRLAEKLSLELTTDYQEQRNTSNPIPGVAATSPFERFEDINGKPTYILGSSISPLYNNYIMSNRLDDHMYYPLIDFRNIDNKTKNVNNRITANFNYNIGKGFDMTFGGIYESSRSEFKNHVSEESSVAKQLVNSYTVRNADGTLTYNVPKGGYLRQENNAINSFTVRAQMNYNKVLNENHSFNGILGAEVRKLVNSGNLASYFGYNDETLLHQPVNHASLNTGSVRGTYQLGSSLQNQFNNWFNQDYVEDRFISAYANLVYSYKNTYSLTGSMRIDQSNLFGTNPKYKYKPLWSLGAAWNLHQEEFLQETGWIDQLKMRLAYGFNGNVAKMSLPEVIARTYLNNYTSPASPSLGLVAYANSSLRWEQTSNFNVGLDYRIFRNIQGNVDYYQKNGTDLMGNAFIDPTIGSSPSLINQAIISNKGIEIGIRADWIAKPNFNWNTGIVVGRNRSKVLDVYQQSNFNPSTLNSVGYVKDYPVGAMFAFRYAGLDSAGYSMIKDDKGNLYHTNNNSINSPTTKLMASDTTGVIRYMGSSIPTINAGLSNRVDFGRFYVFCMINYYGGFKARVPRPNPSSLRPLQGAGEYWKAPGDEDFTDVMGLAAYSSRNSNDAYNYADKYVVNGDYVTLGDLTLSYRIDHLPMIKRAGFSNFEIKGQASNIYTIGFNKYDFSMATGSFQKPYLTPTYTLGIFTNF